MGRSGIERDSHGETPTCNGRLDKSGKVRHDVAPTATWPWLPMQRRGHLARHPWCQHCGSVASVGGERALDLGGIVNLLASIEMRFRHHGVKMTEAQRRLVMKKLQSMAADDTFAQGRDEQMRIIAQTIATYVGLAPQTVESYARSC